jgi:hypothetical protein
MTACDVLLGAFANNSDSAWFSTRRLVQGYCRIHNKVCSGDQGARSGRDENAGRLAREDGVFRRPRRTIATQNAQKSVRESSRNKAVLQ